MDLAGGGATSRLTLLEGVSGARADFLADNGRGQLQLVAQEAVSGAEAALQAPADYPHPLTIFAWTDDAGNGPDTGDLVAFGPGPVTFSGAPLTLRLAFKRGVAPPPMAPPDRPTEEATPAPTPPPG